MVSLSQVALAGIAGFTYGNIVANGGSKGLNLGYSPWIGILLGILIATLVGLLFGAIASRSTGIYFLMITLVYSVIVYYFFGQVTQLSGFGGVQVNRLPGVMGDPAAHPYRLFYVAFGCAAFVYLLIRFVVRTPFGLALQGVRDEPVRMAPSGSPCRCTARSPSGSPPSSPPSRASSPRGRTVSWRHRRSTSTTRSTCS